MYAASNRQGPLSYKWAFGPVQDPDRFRTAKCCTRLAGEVVTLARPGAMFVGARSWSGWRDAQSVNRSEPFFIGR
ncbi:hypothetical protein RRG08_023964 [Elysia crispata]|uniref:Uncharacterized protein n=1 Tax=Elysia crispata TaxID=231223 RepID=A0AAE0YM87_9GAST|nr:hypothetical protein RRG08_023964 [Elysia crispata]